MVQLALQASSENLTTETSPPPSTSEPTLTDPQKAALGAGLTNHFAGPWQEREKNLYQPIESHYDRNNHRNNNNKMTSYIGDIEKQYNRKLKKILKNPNFTVETQAELIRELNRKKKLNEELQKQRNTIPPANSVFMFTGGGDPSTSNNPYNQPPNPQNPIIEGKVSLSKRDRRGMREDSPFSTTDSETETELEESQKKQPQTQPPPQKDPFPPPPPPPPPPPSSPAPPQPSKKTVNDKSSKAEEAWMETIQEIKTLCQKNKLICPYKKLLQAHRILSKLISTKTGRTASPFRLMKDHTLLYTGKKKTMIKFHLIKLLATLCFRTDTLFRFLNVYQPPVHPYSQPERFFIKTLVQMSSYPIHTIPSRKVRQVCQE